MRDPTGELQPQGIGHSDTTLRVYTAMYLAIWCATMHDSNTHVPYSTHQTMVLLPTMHHFLTTNLAIATLHVAVPF